ncbi:UV-induced protein uvi31 [Neolecta irregularis DAH-3]|uniref:UV-induced protein uvi31 n=1 Tax=Neolecta irregularis (strain DAH-3) TaxID=1198029 RepID=A0A1U7LUP8_NEOID|nr:UV-induced protein uvi31 [Neolecta irregularis DAH-3]|eukprot:OLL26400.1 UV-induced protein uvi31 [Neolecta irregularis DAH-3]
MFPTRLVMSLESRIHEQVAFILLKLSPSLLRIHNDSHLHTHHAAMKDNTSPETHFRVQVVSNEFCGKVSLMLMGSNFMQSRMQRHRIVYGLLKDEMNQGIHALQIQAETDDEIESKNKDSKPTACKE